MQHLESEIVERYSRLNDGLLDDFVLDAPRCVMAALYEINVALNSGQSTADVLR